MIANENILASLKSSVRKVDGRVYVSSTDGSTASTIFRHDDYLKSFTVERLGDESKFFGFGVCHKANIKLRDVHKSLSFTTAQRVRPYFRGDTYPYPFLNITEVHRDENTNELSITAYDALYKASSHKVSELELTAPYTIQEVVKACADFLGLSGIASINVADNSFSASYEEGANFEGSETIREALDAAAEATQTIYYINRSN